jgi:peptide/nickel transport system permease protein
MIASNRPTILGLTMVMLLLLVALLAPVIVPYDPIAGEGVNRLLSPSLAHPFGTDTFGRDILSRVIYGARVSLLVGIASIALGTVAGTILGLSAGYFGGRWDNLVCRILDVFFGIPALLFAMALSASLGTGLVNPIVSIAVINVPFFARMARGPTLVEKSKEYVLAARSIGATDGRILARGILPNILPYVLIQASLSVSYAILIESALSFIGLGIQPPTAAWGSMLSENQTFLELAPWTSIFPGLAIVVTVLGFNLAGDGLRDALDPVLRGVR